MRPLAPAAQSAGVPVRAPSPPTPAAAGARSRRRGVDLARCRQAGDRVTCALAGSSPVAAVEVAIVAVVVAAYLLSAGPGTDDPARYATAVANADAVVDAQRSVGLLLEPTLQGWALAVPAVIVVANVIYGSLHFLVTPAVLVWLFRRHRCEYPLWRNTLAFSSLIAFAAYQLWPLAPPRLAGGSGGSPLLQDTLATHATLWSFDSALVEASANPIAAMPSMHVGWAFACAWAVAACSSRRWARWAAWAYPALVTAVIVVTGNHYLADAAGGVAVVVVGHAIAVAVRRAAAPAQRAVDRLAALTGSPSPSPSPSAPSVPLAPRRAGRGTARRVPCLAGAGGRPRPS